VTEDEKVLANLKETEKKLKIEIDKYNKEI